MHLLPLILDFTPSSAGDGAPATLALPLATGTVLDYLVSALSTVSHRPILVVTDAAGKDGCSRYAWPETLSQVRVISLAQLGQSLVSCEASDYLLILDARYWPAKGYDLANVVSADRYRGATHFIAVGNETSGPRERVECDAEGRIRRVQRLYDSVTWSGSTTDVPFCSIVPALAVSDVDFRGLAQLREHLLDKGMFTQDLPYASNAWDLTRAVDLLALNERTICASMVYPKDPGFYTYSPGVLTWETCTILPSVRFIPPVIVHPYARIEDGATLVGPVVIGCRAVVGQRAVVAKSVLTAGASVAPGARVRQQVVVRQDSQATASTAGTAPSSPGLHPSSGALSVDTLPATREPSIHRRRRRAGRGAKRPLDVVLASLGLILLLPLLAVVAALVKLTSSGPVFFIHRREGQHGREFGCLKFRTMVVDAHALQRELYQENQLDGPQFKMANDPRVTRMGRWLRATNIDELPQLINVLAGHMSLVGPRPSPFRENQICVPWRLARLSVKPGITGLWQLCRDRRSEGDFHQWIYYDIAYVKHFSLWLDLRILFHTIVTMGGRTRVPLSKLIPAMTEPEQQTSQSAVVP